MGTPDCKHVLSVTGRKLPRAVQRAHRYMDRCGYCAGFLRRADFGYLSGGLDAGTVCGPHLRSGSFRRNRLRLGRKRQGCRSRLFSLRLRLGFRDMDWDFQRRRLERSVCAVGEEAGGAFAVQDVGASRLFEQSETGEHRGRPQRRAPVPIIEVNFWEWRNIVPDQRSGPLV